MRVPMEEIINGTEGKTLEFKRDLSSPQKVMKTLVAFANSAGGTLLIGIDNNKNTVGVKKPLHEEERLCNLIADSIEPRLVPNVELVDYKKKTLLVAEVFPSSSRPHWMHDEGPLDGVYVRLGSTNRKADRALVEEIQRSVSGTTYDEMPMPELSGKALDVKAAKAAFKGVRSLTQKDLHTLKMLVRNQGRNVPSVGGMLLFGVDRDHHFPDAWIQCGRFAGKTKSNIQDHTEIYEHLPIAVEQALAFIKKHSMRGADLSQTRRRDVWSIPETIAREAVINAVVHADYSQSGAPIRIAIYDDRVEIENPGILLPGLTLDDVRQGVSKLRNRVIGRVFLELGLIEQWGSGILRIFDEASRLGFPEPTIEEIGMRLRFTLHLKEMDGKKYPKVTGNGEVTGKVTGEVTPQATPHVAPHVTPQVAPQVGTLIKSVSGEMNRNELMEALELSDRMHFSNEYLRPAIEAGLIEMTIPDKPRSSKQQYRLTEIGRQVRDELVTSG